MDITSRTPDSAAGGGDGKLRWRRMEVAGIASYPSQRSMQEIAFFLSATPEDMDRSLKTADAFHMEKGEEDDAENVKSRGLCVAE